MPDLTKEERISRAAAKADPEFARQQFNAELDERRFMDAAGTFMVGLYHRAIALMETEEFTIRWREPPDDGFSAIVGIIAALKKVVEEQGDSAPFKLEVALETFSTIARTQAILEGRDPDCEHEGDRTAKLILAAAAMGHCDTTIGLCENGHLEDFADAKWLLSQRGAHLRDRLPKWEESFQPFANAYCTGKSKVTLGELVLEARKWAQEEISAGRNPGIPATDDGITAGLKRMESRGLSIPGRKG